LFVIPEGNPLLPFSLLEPRKVYTSPSIRTRNPNPINQSPVYTKDPTMSDTYDDFRREPAKPHQCVHVSEQDGTRCRATAMHNQIMCFHHRADDIPTVIENDPFLLEHLDTREAIQRALGQVAARLACNHMDFERAKLLLQTINYAMRNLPPHPRPTKIPASRYPEAGSPMLQRGVSSGLSTPVRYPEASASGLSTPVEEEGALAPGAYDRSSTPTPATEPPIPDAPIKAFADFNDEEKDFLADSTWRGALSDYFPRPASLTDQVLEQYFAGRVEFKSQPSPKPSQLAPNPAPRPATLPTLNAAASPTAVTTYKAHTDSPASSFALSFASGMREIGGFGA
jgi:hypothetical protein